MARLRRSSVQKYHDRVAPHYDHSYQDVFWQWHDALTWDYLKPYLPREASAEVADLGCGTGKWAARLVKSGYNVTCVDVSPRMLDQARRKIGQAGGSTRVSFIQEDLNDLSHLPAGRFALAIALGDPIGCTESPQRAMKQIRRILCDRGVLVATFDNRLAALDYYLERGDPHEMVGFLRTGRTRWLTSEKEEQFPIFTFGPAGAIKLAESSGFDVIDVIAKTVLPMRRHRHLLETAEARRAWARVEKRLCRDPDALGRASHLQLTCRLSKN
jgi:ubiquinone/menaquinone biosynthesis C-methylase UbiE